MRRSLPLQILFCLFSALSAFAGDAQWVEVRSPNFFVITDAGDKRGRQAALRFEQMRMAFGKLMSKSKVTTPTPLQIIAFRNTKEMRQFVPLWKGKPIQLSGLFQGSEDRCFILLDMSVEDPWKTVFHEYGHQLLNGNISFRAQPWFDEGFAEFFSTIQVLGNKVNVGMPSEDNATLLLQNRLMKVADLFQVPQQSSIYNETGDRRSIFYAESWLVVHYLYDTRSLPKLAPYFELVLNQGKPVDQAIQTAFGMSPAEFDKAIEQYLHGGRYVYYPIPIPPDFDGSSYTVKPLQPLDIRVVLADVHLHSPDYGDAAMQEFQEVLKLQPDNQAALRGLGYANLRKHDLHQAAEYFGKAAQLDSNDPRVLYYSAVLAQQEGNLASDPERLAVVQKQLEKSIALDPDFADAHSVLAYILMTAGKPDEAVPVLLKAVDLNPRNENYSLNLAQLYLMQRKYDDAIVLLQQLAKSSQLMIATRASATLESARTMKEMASSGREVHFRVGTGSDTLARREEPKEEVRQEPVPATPPPAQVPIKFLKGKLVSVDCSHAPGAELTLVSGTKTWKLQVKDRSHALMMGADPFSCTWTNQKVAVNYRETGAARGDIVSIELE